MFNIADIEEYINKIDKIEMDNKVLAETKKTLEVEIQRFMQGKDKSEEDLLVVTGAVNILREISDESIKLSYEFIENQLNSALFRIFPHRNLKIKLKEKSFKEIYPQLELELIDGDKIRSLKSDSGHGVVQIVSLLCILSIIVITGARRILLLDEVLSGLSSRSLSIIGQILKSFTEIDFQFIINEHGFILDGAQVVHLENKDGGSTIKKSYIAKKSTFLDNVDLSEKVYTEEEEEIE